MDTPIEWATGCAKRLIQDRHIYSDIQPSVNSQRDASRKKRFELRRIPHLNLVKIQCGRVSPVPRSGTTINHCITHRVVVFSASNELSHIKQLHLALDVRHHPIAVFDGQICHPVC
eukprot:m.847187 g.847187  ORF g.847187 m.847187 type:complete len:116 (+) comp23481_c0_seq5:1162-1509(+)